MLRPYRTPFGATGQQPASSAGELDPREKMTAEAPSTEIVAAAPSDLDASSVRRLVEAVDKAHTAGTRHVIVDVSGVQRTAASGVLALVSWAARHSPRARGIVLAGARGELMLTICQTRLQRELDCYPSVDAARKALMV